MSACADKLQVGILISPQGNQTYRVAISYPKRVAESKVKQEIAALLQNTQGNLLSPPLIQHYSLADDPNDSRPVNPELLKRFPVTTSAMFLIAYASSGEESFSVLPAYLGAFRANKSLQVIFARPGEPGEAAPQEFVTPEMKVILTRSVGAERYEVQIRADKGNLPSPIFSASQRKTQESVTRPANQPVKTQGANLSRILLIVFGGLGAGVLICFVATRLITPKTLK